jgi:hypothetical protein
LILLLVGIPLCIRIFFHRRFLSVTFLFFALVQELLLADLALFLFFVSESAFFALLCLSHTYLLLDAMVFNRTQIRLQLFHLRDFTCFWSSIKKEGLSTFCILAGLIVIANSYILWLFQPSFSSLYLFTGLFSLFSLSFLPRQNAYFLAHPLLLPFFVDKPISFTPPPQQKTTHSDTHPLPHFTINLQTNERPHIVFILMESFRARNIDPVTSPNFCRLMKEGIFFSQFYANAVETNQAALSTLQGIPSFLSHRGYHAGYIHNGHLAFAGQRGLLKNLGFETLIGRNEILTAFPKAQGNSWGLCDEYLMRYSADWLEKRQTPTFLTLATMTCHHPWTVPEGYSPLMGVHPFLQTYHYSDAALGLFVDLLREKNLSAQTILFILGDHGQPLGEHGDHFFPQNGLYEENVHVPLLILAEGRLERPAIITDVSSQVDLYATVQDLFEKNDKSLRYQDKERIAFFESAVQGGLRGCRRGPYKYIFSVASQKEELYDLSKDPEEKENRAREHSAVSLHFKSLVQGIREKEKIPANAPDPFFYKPQNPLRMSDETLEEIARGAPHLQRIDLQDCLLLTDRGVQALFTRCPDLEWVNLNAVHELTDAAFEGFQAQNYKMVRLDLLNCPQITFYGLDRLFSACPHLQVLMVNCRQIASFPKLSTQTLITLHIQEGRKLIEEEFIAFLSHQSHLQYLILEDCQQLTDIFLHSLDNHSLKALTIFSCPQFTHRALEQLSRSVTIFGRGFDMFHSSSAAQVLH